jgi:hypothetical protein
MPYDVSWLIENRVLFTIYEGRMPVDEFIAANATKFDFVDNSPSTRIHLIADMSTLIHVKPSVSEMASTVKVLGHERVDWLIGIGMSQIQRIMLKMLGYVFRKRIYAATSKTDALNFLQSIDQSLLTAAGD